MVLHLFTYGIMVHQYDIFSLGLFACDSVTKNGFRQKRLKKIQVEAHNVLLSASSKCALWSLKALLTKFVLFGSEALL